MKFKDLKKKILKENPELEIEIKKDIAFQIGQMLVEARIIKGVTQKKLAELLGTKQPSIAKIENGSTLPSLRFLGRVAEIWGTYIIPPKFAFMEERKERIEYGSVHVFTATGNLFNEPTAFVLETVSKPVYQSGIKEIYH